MFDFVRNNTRILQGILVLLILPSFVLFGIEGYSSFMDKDGEVAAVGRQKINKVEWDNAHRQLVERAQAQQPDVDLALLDSPAARRESLEAVVRQVVLARAAQDQRLVVPPSRVVRVCPPRCRSRCRPCHPGPPLPTRPAQAHWCQTPPP